MAGVPVEIRVAGPTWHFCGTGGNNALEFLGTCEGDTQLNFVILQEGIKTDVSGPMMNHDSQWMGIALTASGMFSWYNETVLLKLMSGLPGFNGMFQTASFNPGQIPLQGLGCLTALEGGGCRYLVYAPYNAKMVGPHSTAWSTRYKRNNFTIECQPALTATNQGVTGVVWNQDVSGIPTFSYNNQGI
jgi:hypothetical protein